MFEAPPRAFQSCTLGNGLLHRYYIEAQGVLLLLHYIPILGFQVATILHIRGHLKKMVRMGVVSKSVKKKKCVPSKRSGSANQSSLQLTDLSSNSAALEKNEIPATIGHRRKGTAKVYQKGAEVHGQQGTALHDQQGAALHDQLGAALNGHQGAALHGQQGAALHDQQGSALNGPQGAALHDQQGAALHDQQGSALHDQQEAAPHDQKGAALHDQQGSALHDQQGAALHEQQRAALHDQRKTTLFNQQEVASTYQNRVHVDQQRATQYNHMGDSTIDPMVGNETSPVILVPQKLGRKQSSKIMERESAPAGTDNLYQRWDSNIVRMQKVVFIVLLLFSLCWLPHAVLLVIVGAWPKDNENKFPASILNYSGTLGILNSLMNVFVYGFKNKDFREAFQRIHRCRT